MRRDLHRLGCIHDQVEVGLPALSLQPGDGRGRAAMRAPSSSRRQPRPARPIRIRPPGSCFSTQERASSDTQRRRTALIRLLPCEDPTRMHTHRRASGALRVYRLNILQTGPFRRAPQISQSAAIPRGTLPSPMGTGVRRGPSPPDMGWGRRASSCAWRLRGRTCRLERQR